MTAPAHRAALTRLAEEFEQLSRRFTTFAERDQKPTHLSVSIAATKLRAGAMLERAGALGAFVDDAWWKDGRAPISETAGWTFDSDDDRYSSLWICAVSSWLTRKYPTHFRGGAAGLLWSKIARDKGGTPIDRNGKPLSGLWYRNGKPLPKSFKGNPFAPRPGETFEYKLLGEPAIVHDSYDSSDAHAHLRATAEVYSDACTVVAELIRNAIGGSTHVGDTVDRRKRGPHSTGNTRRVRRERRATLGDREQQALRLYSQLGTYTAVGASMSISRQAATKLVKAGKARAECSVRSIRAKRLPTDQRGQVNVPDTRADDAD